MSPRTLTAVELVENLARLEKYRTPLYLSAEKMEHWYLQKVSQLVDVGTGEVLSGKLEAGLPGIFKSGVGGDRSTESKVAIDHAIVQGVVAENVARKSRTLIDLTCDEPRKGELCHYCGPARITLMGATVSPETTTLKAAECSGIAAVRRSQETIMRAFDAGAKTIVLTFKANNRAFASIGTLKSVKEGALSSYGKEKSFGILSTLESSYGDVTFLDPIWIWHE